MELTLESFDQLLNLLDPDRDLAAKRYEQVRSRLIKIFVCRGCTVSEELADETINRVAEKVSQIAGNYVGDPALYFYAVAEKIYLEHLRRFPARHVPLPAEVVSTKDREKDSDLAYQCLEECMERLSAQNRELILFYYGHHDDPQEKIKGRKELSKRLGIGANALWIRAHRIRESLKKCVGQRLRNRQARSPKGIS